MKLVRIGTVVAVFAVALLAGTPAMADPPPTNPNTSILTFGCSRGSETQAFQAVAILQSASIAGHRLDGHGTIVFKRIVVNGQVVFDAPGQAGRSDLWSCTIAEFPGTIVDALLTPRQ